MVCALVAAAAGARLELVVRLLLAPAAVLLATVDFAAHRLPDALTLPLAAAALVLLGVAAVLPGTGGGWTSALLGSLILGACYFALLLSNGFGFGDVKLALALGAVLGWYGWAIVLVGTFAGYLLGTLLSTLHGIGLMLAGRADRTSRIPFGPFLLAGTLAGVLLGSRGRFQFVMPHSRRRCPLSGPGDAGLARGVAAPHRPQDQPGGAAAGRAGPWSSRDAVAARGDRRTRHRGRPAAHAGPPGLLLRGGRAAPSHRP